ncbi:PAS domain-containing hybrid sensor histidine kinase/response regulator [Lysobacter xanthus]
MTSLPDQAALLAAVSDASTDVIYVKDRGGRLLYVNPATLRLIGKPAEQVLGRTDAELLDDPDAAARVMANDARIMAAGVAEEVEEIVPDADGRACVWLSRKMPYVDDGGQVIGLLGISRDITERKRLDNALRESRNAMQRILDSITDGLAVLDTDCNYTYLNEQGARLLGVERDALLGRNLWAEYPHAYDSPFGRAYRGAMEGGRPTEVEAFYPEPLNVWMEAHCYPGPGELSVFSRDVTQRHVDAEAPASSEHRLRRVFEASPMGMVTGDADGRILTANDAFLRIVGHDRADLEAGRVRWDRITPPDMLALDYAAIAEAREHGLCTPYEKEYVRADGTRIPVMVGLAHFDDGQLIAFVIDIAARKQAERALQDTVKRKDEFLAMLAHELRNPLAPLGTAHLLRMAPGDTARVAALADVVDRQVRHLTDLVDDLLDVSRVTRGLVELARDPVDLGATVAAAVEQARPLIESRGHALDVDVRAAGAQVTGDANRLVQVLCNLLNNAAKYTPPGGRITLEAGIESGEVVMRVRDTGFGIAADLLPFVFDLFTQAARTPDRTQGGLGIGLALVRSIVELHGGSIAAESAGAGRGSTVRLPLARVAAASAPDTPIALPAGEGRVLVVDDNRDAAQTLAELLRLVGYSVTVADSGRAALQAEGGPWTACVLDIGLPDITGHELARRLRASAQGEGAVLIALTGYGQDRDLRLSRDAGFDHHFVKPVDPATLLRALGPRVPA